MRQQGAGSVSSGGRGGAFRDKRQARAVSARQSLLPALRGEGERHALIERLRPLPNRRRVLQAALVPQSVQPALDLERRAFADIALEGFAVIADRLDDPV